MIPQLTPEEYAGNRHQDVFRASHDTRHGFRVLPALMLDMLEEDRWRHLVRPIDHKEFHHERIEQWVLGKPWSGLDFPSWDALYALLSRAEGGKATMDALKARGAPANGLAQDVKPELTHEQAGALGGRGKKASNNVNSFRRKGNSARYTIARLKRDHQDLAARVIAGELSANAAAIKAGFRKKPLHGIALMKAEWEKLSPRERADFRQWISDESGISP
jgi:hypothetical protein